MINWIIEKLLTITGRLKVSNEFPLFETKNIDDDNPSTWDTRIFGSIINHGAVTAGPFVVGDVITGATSGLKGTITAVTPTSVTYDNTDLTTGATVPYRNDFQDGVDIITGSISGASALVLDHDTGAHSFFDYDTASVRLQTGTVAGQRVFRQTTRPFPYFPIFQQNIYQTYDLEPMENKVQIVIFGDDLNGTGLYLDGLEPFALTRSNTSGSVVDNLIPQKKWIDGRSNTLVKGQIQSIKFRWLGYGNRIMSFQIAGKDYVAIKEKTAGFFETVFMRTPTLPLRCEIRNKATAAAISNMRQVCCGVSTDGGNVIPGLEYSKGISLFNSRTISGAGWHPLFLIRPKNEYPIGKPNRRTTKYLDVNLTTRANDCTAEVRHIHNPLLLDSGPIDAGTWVSVGDHSGFEINTTVATLTAKDMHTIQIIDLISGQAGKGGTGDVDAKLITNHGFISQNPESDNGQMYGVFIELEDPVKACLVSGHFSGIEFS